VNGTVSAQGYVDLLGTPTIVIGTSDIFDFKISGGQGVNIVATGTVELSGGTIESPNGAIYISGGSVDIDATVELFAATTFTIEGTDSLLVAGTLNWNYLSGYVDDGDLGHSSYGGTGGSDVILANGGGSLPSALLDNLTDPGALLAMVQGG
jgi:hypothetical protein